ncbi:MAG: YcaO-like family protein [Candidatus Odinarchaeota archaeon]
MKPYKEADPKVTINRIRNILNELDIFTIDSFFNNSNSNFLSCRLTIGNADCEGLGIGTNGKGINYEFALASAYGELMERMQNSRLFRNMKFATKKFITNTENNQFKQKLIDNEIVLDYLFAQDEKYIDTDEFPSNILKSLTETESREEAITFIKKKLLMDKMLSIPFINITDRKKEYLPINLIDLKLRSNGMSAGNTPEESMLQAICEILERYALKKIFYEGIVPPDIPNEYFKEEKIYENLNGIEERYGLKAIVKDCSLGIGIPVIGLLLIDTSTSSYTFKLGCDTSPVIALERCFTEIYQGSPKGKFKTIELFENSKPDARNFARILISGTGKWPQHIFNEKPTYEFSGHNYVSKSYKEDLKYVINRIESLGHKIYIRDSSFLNFPSYFVYIPGMSEMETNETVQIWNFLQNNLSFLFDLKNASHSMIKEGANSIANIDADVRDLFLYNLSEDILVDNDLFLTMLYLIIEDYSKALIHIDKFIDKLDSNDEDYNYFFIVKTFISLRNTGKSDKEIKKHLERYYSTTLAETVLNDCQDTNSILKNYKFPTCFNCEICPNEIECRYFKIVRIMKNIQTLAMKNPIDQNNIIALLNLN